MATKKNSQILGTISLLLIVAAFCPFAYGKVIYVDDDATGANDGSSWENAYDCLQDALADANDSQKPVEIRVAQGVYRPDRGAKQTPGDREATFEVVNGVSLKGGFAGLSRADRNARNIVLHETILSGDLNGNDIKFDQARNLLIEPTRTENSYHVVTVCSGHGDPAVLNGFTVTGGNAEGLEIYPCWSPDRSGGGLRSHIDYEGRHPEVIIIDCLFRSNSAGLSGGAIDHRSDRTLTAVNCRFIGNSARDGGGIYAKEGRLMLTDCTFSGNLAERGGAISSYRQSGSVLTNCLLAGNSADDSGGALYNEQTRLTLINCLFSRNSAADLGGATYNIVSDLSLTNCTFADNAAAQGGVIFGNIECHLIITNCILWSEKAANSADIFLSDSHGSSAAAISYSDIKGGRTAVLIQGGYSLNWGDGNIDSAPLFADADGADYHSKSQAGRWDPNSKTWVKDDVTSPCIDAGDPASPIGHEPFPNGGRINMGAYGGTAEASKSYFGKPVCETIVAGDINGDCKVDFTDFAIMLLHWLQDNSQPDL